MDILPHIVWAAVAIYVVWRVEVVLAEFTPIAIASKTASAPAEEIPEDLMALAAAETEVWAQEELVRVIQERYDALKDWNRVRSAMGIGIRLEA
jgi:hypothetical protein